LVIKLVAAIARFQSYLFLGVRYPEAILVAVLCDLSFAPSDISFAPSDLLFNLRQALYRLLRATDCLHPAIYRLYRAIYHLHSVIHAFANVCFLANILDQS